MSADQAPDLHQYDVYIIAFSGGKDCTACLLHLLELFDLHQVPDPLDRVELWHHLVDGMEGSELMDWPCTEDYCIKFSEAFGLKLYFSWREGGFEREMRRGEAPTGRVFFEPPAGVRHAGGCGRPGTRRRFPQVSADLSVRWCSAYLKIDVAAAAIRNQGRFHGRRILFISGERAEESAARARYSTFEPHRTDARDGRLKRHVDHWRPVHGWSERQVWAILERWSVRPHPAYYLGWGRLSCKTCIFGSPNQWASVKAIAPGKFEAISAYEREFGVTIQRKRSIAEVAGSGMPYESLNDPALVEQAVSTEYRLPIRESPWSLPAGAYGEAAGPT